MDNISRIKSLEVYQQILADSYGGVLYNVANRGKYDIDQVDYLIELWDGLTPAGKEMAGGIMKGAINFIQGRDV